MQECNMEVRRGLCSVLCPVFGGYALRTELRSVLVQNAIRSVLLRCRSGNKRETARHAERFRMALQVYYAPNKGRPKAGTNETARTVIRERFGFIQKRSTCS